MPASVPVLPESHPHRLVQIPGQATALCVPRYVVRIDIDDPGQAGTHGWQVRHGPRPWRFFTDGWVDMPRPPQRSLEEATAYLARIYEGAPTRIRKKPLSTKVNPIKDVGIRLATYCPRGRNVAQYFIEVSNIGPGTSPKRIYVGTENTVTQRRIQAALKRARQIRAEQVQNLQRQRKTGSLWPAPKKNAPADRAEGA